MLYKSLNSKTKLKENTQNKRNLPQPDMPLGRNLMFSRRKTMIEENVRSLSKIEKEELHTIQPTALRGQPFRVKVSSQNRSGPEHSCE